MDVPYQERENLFTPAYWGGFDIYDDDLFCSVDPEASQRIGQFDYSMAKSYLQLALSRVATGRVTEITYGGRNEFNLNIETGSLVAIDTESLCHWVQGESPECPNGDRPADMYGIFTRPYGQYWLRAQDGTPDLTSNGTNRVRSPNDTMLSYSRSLSWGILLTAHGQRVVQPFKFNTTKMLEDGKIYTPQTSKKVPTHSPALGMPIVIGEVEAFSRTEPVIDVKTNWLRRIKSVDLVYPAQGSKEKSKKTLRSLLPAVRLPKIIPAGV